MVNRYEHVRAALMMSDAFSNTKTSVLGDREHKPRLLPQNLNGAEHMAHRRILNPWFGPVAIDRTESLARRRCQELLDGLMRVGHTDLVSEFALQYPTEVFLAHLGLPIEDGVVLLPLVEAMFRGFFGGDPDRKSVV